MIHVYPRAEQAGAAPARSTSNTSAITVVRIAV
jgi:hypothetical protein